MRFFKNAINVITSIKKLKSVSCRIVYYRKFCGSSTYEIDLKIQNVSLGSYIKGIEKEYAELHNNNSKSNNRLVELQPLIKILNKRRQLMENIFQLKEFSQEKDDEIREIAENEKQQFESEIRELDNELLELLLPVSKDDSSDSIVLEVQAGVGGQEAMLFAKEMFDMYCSFANYKGWELQVADYPTTDIGGIRHATALITGKSVFQYFKHEAGIHRVQRIPSTEKAGRIHTSTVSVVALPQPTDIEINVNEKDLKIETKRSSGAGGQHVNTTDSAVRIVHLPTGITVECQIDRSQIKNRKMALARLTALLYQRELENQHAEVEATRKSQVRTRNRNEKIRTYNYNQDRITDHRLQNFNIHNLKGFFEGGEPLDHLINKLEKQNRLDSLLSFVNASK